MQAFIYIYQNEMSCAHDAVKLGVTDNVKNRLDTYRTSEINAGSLQMVIEVPHQTLYTIEKMIHRFFKHLHIYKDAGTEFFQSRILDDICPYLSNFVSPNFHFRVLEKEEIQKMQRKKYPTLSFTLSSAKIKCIKMPRQDQFEVINKVVAHFKQNPKGCIILPCGMGKTLITLWIAQKMKWSKILIGVPNRNLLLQWKQTLKELFFFADFKTFLFDQDLSPKDEKKAFCAAAVATEKMIVLTTYQSCYKLISYHFDAKICDEMHHLTTKDLPHALKQERKTNVKFLSIPSTYQLGLTATPRVLQLTQNADSGNAIANDCIDSFGQVVVERGLRSAIDLHLVCDYRIKIYSADTSHLQLFDSFRVYDERNKRLLLSAYGMIHQISIGGCSNWLVCANTIEGCRLLQHYIQEILKTATICVQDVFVDIYTSDLPTDEQRRILKTFEASKKAILINVQCLAEGYNFTGLYGVAISEPIHSKIRATQFLTRNLRLHPDDPLKIGTMFIPHVEPDNFEDFEMKRKAAFDTIMDVLSALGDSEEAIYGRITVSALKQEETQERRGLNGASNERLMTDLTDEYIDKIKKFRLKEFNSKGFNETVAYQKIKAKLKGRQIKTFPAYLELCQQDSRFPVNPTETFGRAFKSWADYLGIEQTDFYSLKECREKVNNLMKHGTLKDILHPLKMNNELGTLFCIASGEDSHIPSTIELVKSLYDFHNLHEFFET